MFLSVWFSFTFSRYSLGVKYLPSTFFQSMKSCAFSANFSSVRMPYWIKIFRSSHFDS